MNYLVTVYRTFKIEEEIVARSDEDARRRVAIQLEEGYLPEGDEIEHEIQVRCINVV